MASKRPPGSVPGGGKGDGGGGGKRDGGGGGGAGGGRKGRPAAPDAFRSKQAIAKGKKREGRSETEKDVDRLQSKIRHQRTYISRNLMNDDEWLHEQALLQAKKYVSTPAMVQ